MPPRVGGHRSRRRRPSSLVKMYRPAGRLEIRNWLGFEPLTLPSLTENLEEHFVVPVGQDIPLETSAMLSVGASTGTLYVPRGTDWQADDTTLASSGQATSILSVTRGSVPPSVLELETRRDPSAGDCSTLLIGSTRIRVQHYAEGRSRLTWSMEQSGKIYAVALLINSLPVVAVETVVRDRQALQVHL